LCGDLKVAWAYEDGEESDNARKAKDKQRPESDEGTELQQVPSSDSVRKRE